MTVRNPARSSDDMSGVLDKSRRTIPAHPMGIIQKRPRGEAYTVAQWWRKVHWGRLLQEAIERQKKTRTKIGMWR